MEKMNETGVYQKDDGFWAYRFSVVVDGKRVARRKYTDEQGNKLKTKSEAIKARELALAKARTERERKREISRRTVAEVYEEYCAKGRNGKAYTTTAI